MKNGEETHFFVRNRFKGKNFKSASDVQVRKNRTQEEFCMKSVYLPFGTSGIIIIK